MSVKIGDTAPALSIDGVLGDGQDPGPSLATWRGKVIVLEFAAGWCGPCRALAPHMNEVAEALKGNDQVRVLTVTNEIRTRAEKFRADVKMASPLAYDADGSTWEAYNVRGVPTVFLIDKEGKIAAIGHPTGVTPELVRALVDGEPVKLTDAAALQEGEPDYPRSWNLGDAEDPAEASRKQQELVRAADRLDGLEDATAFAVLRPTEKLLGIDVSLGDSRDLRLRGRSPAALLAICAGVAPDAVDDRAGLAEDKLFDMFIRPADGSAATARQMGRQLVEDAFGVGVLVEKRPASVKLLRRIKDAPPPSAPLGPDGKEHETRAGHFDPPITMAEDLAAFLRPFVGAPVVNDTGLLQPFSMTMEWDLAAPADAPGGLTAALKNSGFELVDGSRPMSWLVVVKQERGRAGE